MTSYTTTQSNMMMLLGRVLLALLFITSGFAKFMAAAATKAYFAKIGVPAPGAAYIVAVAIELGGGILFLLGVKTRVVAVVLAVFTVATAVLAHADLALDPHALDRAVWRRRLHGQAGRQAVNRLLVNRVDADARLPGDAGDGRGRVVQVLDDGGNLTLVVARDVPDRTSARGRGRAHLRDPPGPPPARAAETRARSRESPGWRAQRRH